MGTPGTPALSLRHDDVEKQMLRLPVPSMEQTLKKYIQTITPFASIVRCELERYFVKDI
jgi:hypothetical protein